jgi:hypothetical protein
VLSGLLLFVVSPPLGNGTDTISVHLLAGLALRLLDEV